MAKKKILRWLIEKRTLSKSGANNGIKLFIHIRTEAQLRQKIKIYDLDTGRVLADFVKPKGSNDLEVDYTVSFKNRNVVRLEFRLWGRDIKEIKYKTSETRIRYQSEDKTDNDFNDTRVECWVEAL